MFANCRRLDALLALLRLLEGIGARHGEVVGSLSAGNQSFVFQEGEEGICDFVGLLGMPGCDEVQTRRLLIDRPRPRPRRWLSIHIDASDGSFRSQTSVAGKIEIRHDPDGSFRYKFAATGGGLALCSSAQPPRP